MYDICINKISLDEEGVWLVIVGGVFRSGSDWGRTGRASVSNVVHFRLLSLTPQAVQSDVFTGTRWMPL